MGLVEMQRLQGNSVHGNWGFGFCNWGLGF
jgi:hypothetical protein